MQQAAARWMRVAVCSDSDNESECNSKQTVNTLNQQSTPTLDRSLASLPHNTTTAPLRLTITPLLPFSHSRSIHCLYTSVEPHLASPLYSYAAHTRQPLTPHCLPLLAAASCTARLTVSPNVVLVWRCYSVLATSSCLSPNSTHCGTTISSSWTRTRSSPKSAHFITHTTVAGRLLTPLPFVSFVQH